MTDTPLGGQETGDEGIPEPAETTGRPAGAPSVWDRLRADHERIAADRPPLDLEVPGYHGALLVRYRFVPLKDATRNAEKLARLKDIGEQALLSAVDTLILACQEILVRDPDTGGVRGLADDGDEPIRFDERLARGMNWTPGPTGFSARAIARKLFSNDYALIQQAREVSEWMSESAQEIGDDFLGG